MAFIPRKYDEGKLVQLPAANSQTIVKGDALADNGSGYLAVATSATAVDIHYVAMQSVVTTATGQMILCIETENVLFDADCAAAWTQAQVGTYVDLSTVALLDTSAVTNQLFYVLKGIGVTAVGTKVMGYFTRGIPNT
jgi:hypothetical protein